MFSLTLGGREVAFSLFSFFRRRNSYMSVAGYMLVNYYSISYCLNDDEAVRGEVSNLIF